jgi:small-conductance mechanosensitive channel
VFDRFVVPALLGWVAFALVKAFQLAVDGNALLAQDPLAAASRRTRVAILSRTLGFVIVFVTVALMLLAIPEVRQVGATLLASAGLVGLAVGAAAQPALKSLIAGVQMALTEPVRIDDMVTIDGESGRIEDIRMTYVVMVTPDERRVLVPTTKFLDTTFQNWTRVGGGISGSVTLAVRPATPIAPLREAYLRLLAARPEWDQRKGALSVAEVRADTLDLSLTMSARDPAGLAALRPAMREAMLDWLRENCPEALGAAG